MVYYEPVDLKKFITIYSLYLSLSFPFMISRSKSVYPNVINLAAMKKKKKKNYTSKLKWKYFHDYNKIKIIYFLVIIK